MVRRKTALLTIAVAIAGLLLGAAAAQAAFPGSNGRLALEHFPANFLKGEGWTINPNGSDVRTIVPTTAPTGLLLEVMSPVRFSPDGQRVVYSWMPGQCGARDHRGMILRVANADGTGVRSITQNLCGTALNGAITNVNDDLYPSFSPDGTRVVFQSRRGCLKARDPRCDIDVKFEIWSVRSDGQGLRQLTAGPHDGQPTWSVNNKIAFVRGGDIWTMNPDGSGQTQITSGPADDADPNWSPDGQHLVFASNRDEPGPDNCTAGSFRCHYDIYSMNANGTGITRLVNRPGKEDMAPVFSPDGRKIAWNGDGEFGIDVWTANADGTEPTDVTSSARPGDPFIQDDQNFYGQYTSPDWQPLTGVPPTLPAPALRNQMDPPFTYAGAPPAKGTVFVGERAPAGGTVVTLQSSDPAHAAVPASVTIPAGEQKADYPVTLTAPAADETVTFTATIPGRSAVTHIDLHPPPSDINFFLSSSATSVKAGQEVTIGANLNEPAAAGGTVATFTSDQPSVFPVPATVNYPEGIGGGGFIVKPNAVTEPTVVTLTAHFQTVTHTLTFTVLPGALLSSVSVDQPSITGGNGMGGTVTMTEPPQNNQTVHVALSSSNPAVVSVPAEATVTFGTTASFLVTTNPVVTPQTVTITATYAGQSKTATLTVNPPGTAPAVALSSLSFSPASVTGGTSSTGTVRLASAAPSGGRTVSLSSPNAAVSVPASVTVPANQTSTTFTATTTSVTASTPVDVTASATGSPDVTGRLTVNPAAAPNADRVSVTRADYSVGARSLRVEATSTSSNATLTALDDASGATIGTLSNSGGGKYRGQFNNVNNPGTVRVTSSLGGSATRTVSAGSGTVKTTAPASSAPSSSAFAPFARSIATPQLHATPQVALPAADPADTTAPRISRLRLLPARFRATSQRGTLVSFTLSEPARVTLGFTRLRHGRFVPVTARLVRTLPAGRVRVRVPGPMLGHGVYRVTVNAADARAHTAKPVRARFVVRP